MKSLFRNKDLSNTQSNQLSQVLGAFDLTLLGIGAIIGAGVFVLTGVAAATTAGPGITISYIVAGLASLFAALSYAELATSIGGSGSAYQYAYASFGEIVAWMIGWALILEYTMSVSTVAVGWSGYVLNALQSINVSLPPSLALNGIINLPAILVIAVLTALLCAGLKHSAKFNALIVFIKLATIAFFIIVALGHVKTHNWDVFFPFGFDGVIKGAALVFFAYIGFDALSTAAEETIDPQRNLPIGIILSLVICTFIYVLVSILLTGITPYTTLNVPSPVSHALLSIGYPISAGIIAVGAIAGLTTVMLVMFYGLSRVIFAISRDGLLPIFFSHVNPRTKTPARTICLMGIIIAIIAGFVPLKDLAELVNIGTLSAFTCVCLGVVVTRIRYPDLARPFKIPFYPVIPFLGAIFCIYLMINLSLATWYRFLTWLLVGLIIYFVYSRKHSKLNV